MAKIFITGSSDGLGSLAAKSLISQGHQVVLHGRNEQRSQEAMRRAPGASGFVTADLSSIEETRLLAGKVNAFGRFDAVIHNAGVYNAPAKDIVAVNVLAPYILTCLLEKPDRLIYLSSDMHLGGQAKPESLKTNIERITYSDSKLHVLMICKAVARKYSNVYANAVNPGWVPTKMGGRGAPDDLQKGCETQVWLSVSDEQSAKVSGKYFFHKKESRYNAEADEVSAQERLLELCHVLTGVTFAV